MGFVSSVTAQDQPGSQAFVERDSIRVIYPDEGRASAERTLRAALSPMPLPGIPDAAILPRSTIFLAPDEAAFDSAAHGRPPPWAAAVAIPSQRMIVLPAYGRNGPFSDPVITLRHELAHLALNGFIGSPVPRWFDEGYATWVSGGWDERSGWQIRLALLRREAPTLDSLTLSWPRGEARARLAYLLSASAVRYLATSRGDQAFSAFMESWRAGGSFDTALRSTYQMTSAQFEGEWRRMVRRQYGWLLAVSQTGLLWGAAALLVFVLGFARRSRNRERLEALRREEYMLPESTPDSYDGVEATSSGSSER